MIHIDILLTEDQIAQEFLDALENHDLPEIFFLLVPTIDKSLDQSLWGWGL